MSKINITDVFKVFKHSQENVSWIKPHDTLWPPITIERFFNSISRFKLQDDSYHNAACLKCHPAPCVVYTNVEISSKKRSDIPDNLPNKVCPTDSINILENGYPEIDSKVCIACNLCVVRCPLGAIYWKKGKLSISKKQGYAYEEKGLREQGESITKDWKERLQQTSCIWKIDTDWIVKNIQEFQGRILNYSLKKDSYYPLVRNYFRELGFKAYLGRSGDTQWRFDCITIEPFVMPMEIKSPSEERQITPTAARQAIENAALAESRFGLAIKPRSIAVGYQYPNKRSDVRESLINVFDSFGVSVGLYTSSVLHYLLLRHKEFKFHEKDFQFLFGNTLGACDEAALREFWANYMKWRLEIVTFKSESTLYDTLKNYMPQSQDVESITDLELIQFWKHELTLIKGLNDTIFPVK